MEEKKEFPLRRDAVLKVNKNREVPVTISCRADGACVVLPRSMKDLLFPKVVKEAKKPKQR